uniref:Peroxide-inducible transcript 1 protein n=1 Tax=Acrobeloides nanus TaxID=290746 RepID=A0A914BXK9_9BILA
MAQDQSSMEDKDDPTKVLERTLCQLEKLTLKNEQIAANLVPNKRESSEIVQCPPSCSRILSFSLNENPSNCRFRPYSVPRILRRLSVDLLPHRIKDDSSHRRASMSSAQLYSPLDGIQLEGDFKNLSIRLLRDSFKTIRDSPKNAPAAPSRNPSGNQSCSQEVALHSSSCCSCVSAEEQGEIDELTEYFQHFVAVCPKMSALAESMYV